MRRDGNYEYEFVRIYESTNLSYNLLMLNSIAFVNS
jgi:hypothetical protein